MNFQSTSIAEAFDAEIVKKTTAATIAKQYFP